MAATIKRYIVNQTICCLQQELPLKQNGPGKLTVKMEEWANDKLKENCSNLTIFLLCKVKWKQKL